MDSRIRTWFCLLAFVLPALLLFAACDGGNGQPSPEGTPAAGSTPTVTGQVPQDVPEDFPQYANATVSQTTRFGDQILVTLDTDDKREDVAAFFREALEKPPWKVNLVQDVPEQGLVVISFAHLDKRISGTVSIISIPDTEATVITLRFIMPESVGTPVPGAPSTPSPEGGGSPSPSGGS